MPGPLPDGDPVPVDGSLPDAALTAVGARGFGVYVHVPFCASRCGYAAAVLGELATAARVLGDAPPRRVDTVFVGGGTPTLLDPDDLGRILDAVDVTWGLAGDVEIT